MSLSLLRFEWLSFCLGVFSGCVVALVVLAVAKHAERRNRYRPWLH